MLDNRVGKKIREAREDAGMTQEQLAEKAGLSLATITSLEENRTDDVMACILVKVADALGKKLDDIFFS